MSVDRDLPPLATVPIGAIGVAFGAIVLELSVPAGLAILAAGNFLLLVGAVSLGVEVGIRRARR